MVRATVEESLSLDLDYMEQRDLLRPGYVVIMSWSQGGQPVANIGVLVLVNQVRLQYRNSNRYTGQVLDTVDEPVLLERGAPGGYRTYFLCPRCGRRVRQLHMPPGETRFRCRTCYNLAYQSQNEHRTLLMRLLTRRHETGRRHPRLGPSAMSKEMFCNTWWHMPCYEHEATSVCP